MDAALKTLIIHAVYRARVPTAECAAGITESIIDAVDSGAAAVTFYGEDSFFIWERNGDVFHVMLAYSLSAGIISGGMLEQAEKMARDHGCRFLECSTYRRPVRGFLISNGFRQISEIVFKKDLS